MRGCGCSNMGNIKFFLWQGSCARKLVPRLIGYKRAIASQFFYIFYIFLEKMADLPFHSIVHDNFYMSDMGAVV